MCMCMRSLSQSCLPTPSSFRFPPFALYTTDGRYRIVRPVGMCWCGHVVYPGCVDRFALTVVLDLPGCALSALRYVYRIPPPPHTHTHTDRQTDTHTHRQTHTHTHTLTARHASRQSVQQKRFVQIHINRPHTNIVHPPFTYTHSKQGTAYLFEGGNFVWPGVKPGHTRVVSGGYPWGIFGNCSYE